jgi:hypothetical protein
MNILIISQKDFFKELPIIRFNIKNHTTFLQTMELGKTYNYINKNKLFLDKDIDLIKQVDALLVCNFKKGKEENHVSTYCLILMAIAHSYEKKIYLLYNLPKKNFKEELESLEPICLLGDIKNLKQTISAKL